MHGIRFFRGGTGLTVGRRRGGCRDPRTWATLRRPIRVLKGTCAVDPKGPPWVRSLLAAAEAMER